VLDFTSALYLGMRHPGDAIGSWTQLTTGRPGALADPPGAPGVAAAMARLIGVEAATLAPSTLHLAWDLFDALADEDSLILMDAEIYPISRWGAERAATRGLPLREFPHHDPSALATELRRARRRGRRPILVTDGFCPGCGRFAPLREYLALARAEAGMLVVDDTQALGVFGRSAGATTPYGLGGGGSPARLGLGGPDLLVFASLAKGLGVPLAVLGGSAHRIRRFEQRSETRVHCSPPSHAVIRAAERALWLNAQAGDALRDCLARRVGRFRERLAEYQVPVSPSPFPVQTLRDLGSIDAPSLHARLRRHGVRTVLHREHHGHEARVSFLLTARHRTEELDRAAALLAASIPRHPTPTPSSRATARHEQSIHV